MAGWDDMLTRYAPRPGGGGAGSSERRASGSSRGSGRLWLDTGRTGPTFQTDARTTDQQPGGGASDNGWLVYQNEGKIRNLPLSDNLVNAMSFLPSMGVSMVVHSGGQEGSRRTGSHRHDHGNAADVTFYQNGRMLDWADRNDRPIFEEIVARARQSGITGIGAGPGYMGRGMMHVGFGSNAVWGAGGKGVNAPDWLRAAYASAAAPRRTTRQDYGRLWLDMLRV